MKRLVALCVLLVVAPLLRAPVATAAPGCAPVEIVAFRGSGQEFLAAQDGQGSTLARVTGYARTHALADGRSLAGVPVHGVDYPAVGLDRFFGSEMNFLISTEQGVAAGVRYVTERRAACPATRFLLTGYSQGAYVARQVAQQLPAPLLAGVFTLSDPLQLPDAPGARGGGASGEGVLRFLFLLFGIPTPSPIDDYNRLPVPKYSYCIDFDGICDKDGFLYAVVTDLELHTSYGEDPAELAELATVLTTMARAA